MKLVFFITGCVFYLNSSAQTAGIVVTQRPNNFETVDVNTLLVDRPPMEKAVIKTAQISEFLSIEDHETFEALLEANYNAEYALSKILTHGHGNEQPDIAKKKIEKDRDKNIKKILNNSQYQAYLDKFGTGTRN